MFQNKKFVGLLDQPRSTQRYSAKIRDGEDRLIECMVDLEAKYGRRYECRGIVAFLQREGLESGATKGAGHLILL